jgi:hypothetical protein
MRASPSLSNPDKQSDQVITDDLGESIRSAAIAGRNGCQKFISAYASSAEDQCARRQAMFTDREYDPITVDTTSSLAWCAHRLG